MNLVNQQKLIVLIEKYADARFAVQLEHTLNRIRTMPPNDSTVLDKLEFTLRVEQQNLLDFMAKL